MVSRSSTHRVVGVVLLTLTITAGMTACSSDESTPTPADSAVPDASEPDTSDPASPDPDTTGDSTPAGGGINGPAQVDPDFSGLGDGGDD